MTRQCCLSNTTGRKPWRSGSHTNSRYGWYIYTYRHTQAVSCYSWISQTCGGIAERYKCLISIPSVWFGVLLIVFSIKVLQHFTSSNFKIFVFIMFLVFSGTSTWTKTCETRTISTGPCISLSSRLICRCSE